MAARLGGPVRTDRGDLREEDTVPTFSGTTVPDCHILGPPGHVAGGGCHHRHVGRRVPGA
eukprot:5851226-Alexandrium_andersonii.AAC.1